MYVLLLPLYLSTYSHQPNTNTNTILILMTNINNNKSSPKNSSPPSPPNSAKSPSCPPRAAYSPSPYSTTLSLLHLQGAIKIPSSSNSSRLKARSKCRRRSSGIGSGMGGFPVCTYSSFPCYFIFIWNIYAIRTYTLRRQNAQIPRQERDWSAEGSGTYRSGVEGSFFCWCWYCWYCWYYRRW